MREHLVVEIDNLQFVSNRDIRFNLLYCVNFVYNTEPIMIVYITFIIHLHDQCRNLSHMIAYDKNKCYNYNSVVNESDIAIRELCIVL